MPTAPVRIDPPAAELPMRDDGQHTKAWADYHQSVSDRLGALPAQMRRGVTDGSDAAAGDIGEYLEASFPGPVTLPDGVAVDVGMLPLEAGDWDVSGTLVYASSTSNMRIIQVWVGFAPVTAPPFGLGRAVLVTSSPLLATGIQLVTGPRRLSLAGTRHGVSVGDCGLDERGGDGERAACCKAGAMKHDLEAIRVGVAERLGDVVASVQASERDHGYVRAIGITTPDGWRCVVALDDDATADEVVDALQDAIAARRMR